MKIWQNENAGFVIVFLFVAIIVVFTIIEQLNQNL